MPLVFAFIPTLMWIIIDLKVKEPSKFPIPEKEFLCALRIPRSLNEIHYRVYFLYL